MVVVTVVVAEVVSKVLPRQACVLVCVCACVRVCVCACVRVCNARRSPLAALRSTLNALRTSTSSTSSSGKVMLALLPSSSNSIVAWFEAWSRPITVPGYQVTPCEACGAREWRGERGNG